MNTNLQREPRPGLKGDAFRLALQDRLRAHSDPAAAMACAAGMLGAHLGVARAGYGEIVEAVSQLAPAESVVEGLEPMGPKAADARSRGLRITQDYLRPGHPPVDVISSIDVFSHVPDYRAFLRDVAGALKPGGRVIIETGNLADVSTRGEFPFELGLPDGDVIESSGDASGEVLQASDGAEVGGGGGWRT